MRRDNRIGRIERAFLALGFAVLVSNILPAFMHAEEDMATQSQNQIDRSKHLWLEDVEGEAALAWVGQQNTRSLDLITAHPHYPDNLDKMVKLATSQDRIAYGTVRDGMVYNFWQDDVNIRGIWRRASIESYYGDNPDWETVIDFDRLADSENRNWVFKGANCLQPLSAKSRLCFVALSDGGKDAVIHREFDLETRRFVEDGFETLEAKQGIAWIDANRVLIATDWGGDGSTLTESGYPSSVRLWHRGAALDTATEIYRGAADDVGVWPWARELENGKIIYGAVQSPSFFTSRYWLLSEGQPLDFPLPDKATLDAYHAGWQFVTLQEDWRTGDTVYKNGDLVAFRLEDFLQTRSLSSLERVFRPTSRQAVNGVSVAKGAALLSINDNVTSKILRLERTEVGIWTLRDLALPGIGRASIAFANPKETRVFINYEGFLTPDSLLSYDVEAHTVSELKALPDKFETDGLVVHQYEATSSDGTQIPYFIVHSADMPLTASTPTLLYGYGGFNISMRPSYSASTGQLWLEKGGAYVLANIRGGGEFGPTWHQAGLKLQRQRVYDDFIAVAEDLIARQITAPKHLGIMGGSNGGLLMEVMLTQRPELWNAIVIQVPLLDMLRYHLLLAGASWIDEYGDPDIADEYYFLHSISPYHQFDPKADYPTPLFVTSTKDDRVHPAHARKMAKLFEESGKPFLYYENIDGGHSAAANQQERAKRTALEFTYLQDRLFP